MAEHHLRATAETVHWGYFEASRRAVLEVASGDVVTIDTLSAEPEDMPPDEFGFTILPELIDVHKNCERGPGPHYMTGPVHVEGAVPGDVLEVEIIMCKPRQDWGWNIIEPLMGTLPEDFPEQHRIHIPIDLDRNVCRPPWGKELALSPFFGVMGVAPPSNYGRINSIEPREHGGNIDNKELVEGTTLYLPVWNEGALFSAGDGHGVQGDGEVCLTALETALTGTFRLTVRKDMQLILPMAESSTHYITMGLDPDLDDAAKQALRGMIALVVEKTSMSREHAYALCSLAADMRITQLVDGNKGVHTMLSKDALP
jgi:acetamidase/formamidase